MATIDEHVIDLVAAVARIESKIGDLDKNLNGNGQPGLQQRVQDLEASKNRTVGAIAVLGTIGTGIWGLLEYVFHVKSH